MRDWVPVVCADDADPADLATRDAIGRMLSAARKALDMDVALVTALHDGKQTVVQLDGDGASFGAKVGSVGAATNGYCQYVVSGELPNVIRDAGHHPFARTLPATTQAGIGSYVGVPLTLTNGRAYGALCVTSRDPRFGLDASHLAFMRFLAHMVAAELSAQEARSVSRSTKRDALAQFLTPGGIDIVVQPIVDLDSGRVRGVEALSRFAGHHASPADVFAAAADVGLGVALELAAIRAALELLPLLPDHVYLSVNASPAAAVDPGLAQLMSGLRCDRIVLELTEHASFGAQAQLQGALDGLRGRGLRIAVDDTGAGYASLQNILSLAPEVIKLDLALVSGIDRDPVRRALARALGGFAHECGASLIAEGIETAGELATLRDKGVLLGQGYFLARPAALGRVALDAPLAV